MFYLNLFNLVVVYYLIFLLSVLATCRSVRRVDGFKDHTQAIHRCRVSMCFIVT